MVIGKGTGKMGSVLEAAFCGEGFYGVEAPVPVFAEHAGHVRDPELLQICIELTAFMFPDDGREVGRIGIESGCQFMQGHPCFEKEEVLFEGLQFQQYRGGQTVGDAAVFRSSRGGSFFGAPFRHYVQHLEVTPVIQPSGPFASAHDSDQGCTCKVEQTKKPKMAPDGGVTGSPFFKQINCGFSFPALFPGDQ